MLAASRIDGKAPPRRAGDNLLDGDRALLEALRREGGGAHEGAVRELGTLLASVEAIDWGFAANVHAPRLRGEVVEFHSAWHELMRLAVEHGVAGAPWADARPGAHVARAAKFLMVAQVEAGSTCPLAMAYASVPALRLNADVASVWEQPATARAYDPRNIPIAAKSGALVGIAWGRAVAEADGNGGFLVSDATGMMPAAQSDGVFLLAQAPGGCACMFVARRRPDGSDNGFRIRRLHDKVGNRSNATAELELRDAHATLVGEEGRGDQAIMEMIASTWHDRVLASAAVMRLGVAEAIHHGEHRGDEPVAVLADLALEAEAATAAALRLSRAYDEARAGDADADAFRRLAAPILRSWICTRAPGHAAEALACQGGSSYLEDSRLARAYREAPLMSIWEGSPALEFLRALDHVPAEPLLDEIALAGDPRIDAAAVRLRRALVAADEWSARGAAGLAARCLQASLLVRFAPAEVADAFCATRLDGHEAYGVLPAGTDAAAIVTRNRPG